jgi:hypothetical protein
VNTQSSQGRGSTPVRQQQRSQSQALGATLGRAPLLFALILAFTLLGAANAVAITRDTVLARAQTWVDNPVPYSQARYFGGYRTDCSGYVSMCWKTGTSWSTRSFHTVSHRIAVATLRPGDAMLKAGYHIRLFYGWVDAGHTRYVTYEQTGPNTKSSIKSMASDLAAGYLPFRYNGIEDSPASRDALSNGSFNVWASGDPVWWSQDGPDHETLVAQRRNLAKMGKFSLELINPTASASHFVSLEQTAAVSAETTYTLSAWARTAGDSRLLELRLRYLDASGTSLIDRRTTGAAWGIDDTGFKQMSLPAVTPAGAVTALVTLRVAGATDASGTAGNSAVFDELSLARPQATITIKTSTTATYIGKTAVLSGSVTPTSAIGRIIIVYVQKPGTSRWSYSSNRVVYASGDGAAWLYKYYFKPGMTKGIYNYRAEIPALPGYLGASSPTSVSVRLK